MFEPHGRKQRMTDINALLAECMELLAV